MDDALIGMLGWGLLTSSARGTQYSQFGRGGTISSYGGRLVSWPSLSNHWALGSARNYSTWGSHGDEIFEATYDWRVEF